MQQYQLRTSRTAPNDPQTLQYHVAKLNCKEFHVGQFHSLRLYRGSLQTANGQRLRRAAANNSAGEEDQEMTDADHPNDPQADSKEDADDQAAASKNKMNPQFKRKTRVYYDSYESYGQARQLRKQEAMPWILEDADDGGGEVNFIGRLEAAQADKNYVLFVYENGVFSVIPVSRWYNFQQRITYRTLTVEEAEAQENDKRKTMNKWMMHKLVRSEQQQQQQLQQQQQPAQRGNSKNVTINSNLVATSNSGSGRKQSIAAADEILFDETFDDDEEYGDALDDEEAGREAPLDDELEMRKKGQLRGEDEEDFDEDRLAADRSRLREQAKDTTKLLRKMHQDVFMPGSINYDELGLASDSDDEDPYASSASGTETEDSEAESDNSEEIEKQLKNLGGKSSKASSVAGTGAAAVPTAATKLSNSVRSASPAGSMPVSRSASPALTAGSSSKDGAKRKRPAAKESDLRSSRAGSPASVTSDQSASVVSGIKPSKKLKQQRLPPSETQTEGGESDDLITREDVVQIFQQAPNQSTTTAHLIKQLKRKLKKDKRNQTLLIDIVKRVAQKSADGNMWTLKQ